MDRIAPEVERVFFAALDLASPEARAAYLDAACGKDSDLRRQVERMLASDGLVSRFLESPAAGPTPMIVRPRPPTARGPRRSHQTPYRSSRKSSARGGWAPYSSRGGSSPVRRQVALKIIKPGMDTKQVIARFEAERQALAMMDHPNIAKVLDGGATGSGRPYFVMEFVRGVPITDYCDAARLPINARLELFVLVCRAVQHAHQKGVIHRDIKPSNVLVAIQDGVAAPKVIDFGVSKATGQSSDRRDALYRVRTSCSAPRCI